MEVTTFILAGGKSTRMGTDKAFVQLGEQTLLERALSTARAIAPTVRIVGDQARLSPYGHVIEDIFPDRGPLGGIHAALVGTTTELNLVLAVDLPFVGTEFPRFLLERAGRADALVTVPRAEGRYQPLCAVYRRQFAKVAERSLESGSNKIDALFPEISTLVIEESELLRNHFSCALFRNLNRPEELEQARQQSSRNRLASKMP